MWKEGRQTASGQATLFHMSNVDKRKQHGFKLLQPIRWFELPPKFSCGSVTVPTACSSAGQPPSASCDYAVLPAGMYRHTCTHLGCRVMPSHCLPVPASTGDT